MHELVPLVFFAFFPYNGKKLEGDLSDGHSRFDYRN